MERLSQTNVKESKMAETKTIAEVKAKLEQKLGQLVMQVGALQKELQKAQKQTNDTATAIEKLNG